MKRSLFFAVCLVAALGTPKLFAAEAHPSKAQVPSVEKAAPVCSQASTAKTNLDLLKPITSSAYCCQNARIACRNDCAPCHFAFVCAVYDCDSDCECAC